MIESRGYRIDRLETLGVETLAPHPDALMPIDDEDRAAIRRSIEETGILDPLLVGLQADAAGVRPIYDGCNRWRAAQELGLAEVPCLLVETSDPKSIVTECLMAGRKRSTGQRILAYLEQYSERVLAAAECNGEIRKTPINVARSRDRAGAKLPLLKGSFDPSEWTCQEIANRLHCSDKDVLLGIDLLRCAHAGQTLPDPDTGKAGEADADYMRLLHERRAEILMGAAPIRRWKAALYGALGGKKTHGKASTDYAAVCARSLISLGNCFENWQRIPFAKRAGIKRAWAVLQDALPEDLR